jgi:ribonuclease PH
MSIQILMADESVSGTKLICAVLAMMDAGLPRLFGGGPHWCGCRVEEWVAVQMFFMDGCRICFW